MNSINSDNRYKIAFTAVLLFCYQNKKKWNKELIYKLLCYVPTFLRKLKKEFPNTSMNLNTVDFRYLELAYLE